MGAPDPFQADVARVALHAARQWGFALAGGHALIAHGLMSRPTEDVDLFTDQSDGVVAAGRHVVVALRGAGLAVEEIKSAGGLGDLFEGLDLDLVEYEVRRGDQQVRLQLVRFDRLNRPVAFEIGPVLHIDDVVATKVAALATRAEPRDLIDVAAILSRYTREQLMGLARRADAAVTEVDFADAMRRLDRLHDDVFGELYGLTPEGIATLRDSFAGWPRR